MVRIGVDVGGTNTDAVVMSGRDIIAATKVPTSSDVTSGLMGALNEVLGLARVEPEDVGLVVIGTTHFTNAVIERRHLATTATLRLCLPAAQNLEPMVDWPLDLRSAVAGPTYMASGGAEFDGAPIIPFDRAEISRIGLDIRTKGIDSIAVCGIFSPVNDRYEREALAILTETCPDAAITISSEVGQLGLLERESATILNSSLLALARRTVKSLGEGLASCGIRCPFYLSQNDGTLMSAAQASRFPVLTFASGPTNSMRGAAFLSGHQDAIVLDVGGTTTDVGLLQQGFPRQVSTTVDIGGVRTNFRMPDVFSIGLGGGSRIAGTEANPTIGPQSVGYRITTEARVFGGEVLTASDIAVAAGRARMGDGTRVTDLSPTLVRLALARIDALLENAVDRSRVSAAPLPILAVGGGSVLIPDHLAGLPVTRPAHYSVANAIGAAIAQVSGEVDRVCSLEGSSREAALAAAEQEARAKAVAAGAIENTIIVTEREDVPLAYLRGDATRVRVKVAGDMRI